MHRLTPALSQLALLAALALPSVNTAFLNGLPFDTPLEIVSCAET